MFNFFKNRNNKHSQLTESYKRELLSLIRYLKFLVLFFLLFCTIILFKISFPFLKFGFTILSPLFIGLLIAYLLNPMVNKLAKVGIKSHTIRAFITYLIFISIFLLLIFIIVPPIFAELYSLTQNLPEGIQKLKIIITKFLAREDVKSFLVKCFSRKKEVLSSTNIEYIKKILSHIFKSSSTFIIFLKNIYNYIFYLFTTFFLGLLLGFYLLKDIHKLWFLIKVLIPNQYELRTLRILKKIDIALYGFLKGQLLVCFFIGVLTFIGLTILGIKYAFLIGFIAGLANIIPYFGPIIGATPAILQVIVTNYPDFGTMIFSIGKIILLFIIIQSIDGFFLSPRIIGEKAELHPVIVILSLVIGSSFGIGGMIVAVPVAIILKTLFLELFYRPAHIEQLKFEKKTRREKST